MKYSVHNVFVKNPHPQSLAALVVLTKKLSPKPTGYKVWLKYRSWYLRQYKKTHKQFRCHYCNHGPLKKQSDNLDWLATLDHVHPTSKGGPKFLSTNIVIACHPCNNRKQDKSVEEFTASLNE